MVAADGTDGADQFMLALCRAASLGAMEGRVQLARICQVGMVSGPVLGFQGPGAKLKSEALSN